MDFVPKFQETQERDYSSPVSFGTCVSAMIHLPLGESDYGEPPTQRRVTASRLETGGVCMSQQTEGKVTCMVPTKQRK